MPIAALEYWKNNNPNKYADLDDLDAISDIINRGHRTEK
jgi:predicted chitinase